MPLHFDKTKTLRELDGQDWGEPQFGSSVVTNVHRLRRIPLDQFTAEDLRLMLGQNISLEYLVPLALEHLESNPMLAGGFHPGGVLLNLSGIERGFWDRSPEVRDRTEQIIEQAMAQLENVCDKAGLQIEEEELRERLAQAAGKLRQGG